MSKYEIGEILGISVNEESKTAIVKFNVNRIATPYRKLITRKKGNACKIYSNEAELEFVYFDTGWQVKSKK